MKMIFSDEGDFQATYAAERWCAENGISVGRMQRGSPRGLKRGDFDIQKWRNLDADDIATLDGRMTGDARNGPIVIELDDESDLITEPTQ